MGNLEQVAISAVPTALDRIVRSSAAFIDSLPVGVYCCDPDGFLSQYNDRAAELWGRTPAIGDLTQRYCGALASYRLDGASMAPHELPMAEALQTGEAVRDRELVIERPDGRRLTILVNVNPMFDEQGRVSGAVNCFQDVTELRRMQTETREGRHVFINIMNALPSAVYATDPKGYLIYYNTAAIKMWGFEPKLRDQQWCGSWKIYSPEGVHIPHDQCPMAVALREQRPVRGIEAVAERPDGTRVPFLPYPTPIFSTDGKMVGAVNLLYDLTETKRAEAQQKALIDELNHRVKNTLATVQSLAAQSFRDSGEASCAKQVFEQRLLALSRTHDQLTRERWEWADLKAIIGDVLAPHRAEQIHLDEEPVRLPPKVALTLAMVLHELATNAAKYGSLSVPDGALSVSWSAEGEGRDRRLKLAWRESNGPLVVPPVRKGFGSKLIERSVAQDLGGQVQLVFDPNGLRYTCDVALTR
jgi:PAS domain S-box-containing protein